MSDTSYLDDIKIEGDALDLEWLHHPQKYMKWAEKAAQAEDRVKLAKEKLEVTDAKIDKEIRTTSQEKVTEKAIANAIALDERHQEALQKLNDALYESNLYSAAVKAMEHRKAALENLAKLWVGSYFSGPSAPRDILRAEKQKDDKNVKGRDEARKQTSKKVDYGENN